MKLICLLGKKKDRVRVQGFYLDRVVHGNWRAVAGSKKRTDAKRQQLSLFFFFLFFFSNKNRRGTNGIRGVNVS